MDRGIIYIASGQYFVDQATASASSVKIHNPDLHISLFTDENDVSDIFDKVNPLVRPVNGMANKRLSGDHIIHDKNLYLDADTRICANLQPIFDVLDDYELAMAADSFEWNRQVYENNDINLPSIFPEFNCGVIAYTDSNNTRTLFSRWNKIFDELDQSYVDHIDDQSSMRIALSQSDIKLFTLPPEYNFRLNRNFFAETTVKILHRIDAKYTDLAAYERLVNSSDRPRLITYNDFPCDVQVISQSTKYRLKRKLVLMSMLLQNDVIRNQTLAKIKNKQKDDMSFQERIFYMLFG